MAEHTLNDEKSSSGGSCGGGVEQISAMPQSNGSCACCSSHEHDHEGGEEGGSFKEGVTIALCTVFFFLVMGFEGFIERKLGYSAVAVLYAIPYLICGVPVFKAAFRGLKAGDYCNEFTLMGVATIAAIALGQMSEAVGVMIFYSIGEFLQEKAAGSSRASIKSLLATKPSQARIFTGKEERMVPVEEVVKGQEVLVRAGEKIPLDGTVVSGSSELDTSPLTGESLPVSVAEGSEVYGGTINLSGTVTIRVEKAFTDTHMAKIIEMIEHAAANKAPTERFISRFARYYTPAVVAIAAIVAFLPPLVFADATLKDWGYRALVLLIISCPCALLISIPLSYFAGIGAASRFGILVKGGHVFDDMMHVKSVVFDKTGTLTYGKFAVSHTSEAQTVNRQEMLEAALLAEFHASHPIAKSVVAYARQELSQERYAELIKQKIDAREVAGKGMDVQVDGHNYLAGTQKLLSERGVIVAEEEHAGALVHIARDGAYLGTLYVEDTVKPDAAQAMAELKALGVSTCMLTGDRELAARAVAEKVGVDKYRAGLLPDEKVAAMESISGRHETAFVGDGINDAPALAISRVGIAMGGIGSEAAVEAADAVILNDSPQMVARLFKSSKKVRTIVWQNIIFALGTKGIIMIFGIAGLSGLWEAIFADVGVALIAVLNATRVSR